MTAPTPSGGDRDPHPKYGPCDGFGPRGECSVCTGLIAKDDGSLSDLAGVLTTTLMPSGSGTAERQGEGRIDRVLSGFDETDAIALPVYYRVSPRFIADVRAMRAALLAARRGEHALRDALEQVRDYEAQAMAGIRIPSTQLLEREHRIVRELKAIAAAALAATPEGP